jgi:hypothetical protein
VRLDEKLANQGENAITGATLEAVHALAKDPYDCKLLCLLVV